MSDTTGFDSAIAERQFFGPAIFNDSDSVYMSEARRTQCRITLQTRFSHLPEARREKAERDFFSHNLIDFGDLYAIGEKRLFDEDEAAEFDRCLAFEEFANNETAVEMARDIRRTQAKFRREAKPAAESAPVKKPETKRQFEAFLRDAGGFSKNEAVAICNRGFYPAARRDDARQ